VLPLETCQQLFDALGNHVVIDKIVRAFVADFLRRQEAAVSLGPMNETPLSVAPGAG